MAKTWDLSRKARQSGVFHQLRCRFPRFGIPRVAKSPSPASRVRADSPENRAIQAATGTGGETGTTAGSPAGRAPRRPARWPDEGRPGPKKIVVPIGGPRMEVRL